MTHPFVEWQDADEVSAHLLTGVGRVADAVECDCGVSSRLFEEDVVTAGMMTQHVAHVVNEIVHNEPTVAASVVHRHLLQCVFRQLLPMLLNCRRR